MRGFCIYIFFPNKNHTESKSVVFCFCKERFKKFYLFFLATFLVAFFFTTFLAFFFAAIIFKIKINVCVPRQNKFSQNESK